MIDDTGGKRKEQESAEAISGLKILLQTLVFVFQKYGKLGSVLVSHFIEHKPLSSKE